MGGSCELTDGGLIFTGTAAIHGIDVDLGEVGELTPGHRGGRGARRLPVHAARRRRTCALHETDRLAALTKEINELGGDVTETADGLRIRPRPLHGGVFHTYDDHRMATAGAVIGLAVDGVQIENVATTAKTLPDFPGPVDRRCSGDAERSGCRMRRYGKHTDEDDIRVRPNRKGNRPRTKIRPKHEDAAEGMVLTVDRGRLPVWSTDRDACTAMKARELGRKAAVVGDRVALVGDLSGGEGHAGPHRPDRAERASVLRRTRRRRRPVRAGGRRQRRPAGRSSPRSPTREPRPRLIDRCLVAAYDGGLDPLLVLTKSDLAPPDELLERTATSDVPSCGHQPRRRRRVGRTACATGCAAGPACSSATPASARRPWSTRWSRRRARATGQVNAVTGRGRHTTHLGARAAAAGRAAG